MRSRFFIIAIAFAATLAYVIGNRLSNKAMAVVVGAVCGTSASIPVSLALYVAANKNWGRAEADLSRQETDEPPQPPVPPMIFVAPPMPQAYSPPHYFPLPLNDAPRPREFKIIGEE